MTFFIRIELTPEANNSKHVCISVRIVLLSTKTFSIRRTIIMLYDLEHTYDVVALVLTVAQEPILVIVFLVCIKLVLF